MGSPNKNKQRSWNVWAHKNCRLEKNLVSLIIQSWLLLSKNIENNFPSIDVVSLAWERDPFVVNACESAVLIFVKWDALAEIKNYLNYIIYLQIWLHFRLVLQLQNPIITKKAMEILHFSTSYMHEAGYSYMNTMKSQKYATASITIGVPDAMHANHSTLY